MGNIGYVLGGLVGFVLGAAVSACLHRFTVRKINKAKSTTDVMTVSGLRYLSSIVLFLIIFLTRKLVPFSYYATLIGAALGLTSVSIGLSNALSRRTVREEEQRRREKREESEKTDDPS